MLVIAPQVRRAMEVGCSRRNGLYGSEQRLNVAGNDDIGVYPDNLVMAPFEHSLEELGFDIPSEIIWNKIVL